MFLAAVFTCVVSVGNSLLCFHLDHHSTRSPVPPGCLPWYLMGQILPSVLTHPSSSSIKRNPPEVMKSVARFHIFFRASFDGFWKRLCHQPVWGPILQIAPPEVLNLTIPFFYLLSCLEPSWLLCISLQCSSRIGICLLWGPSWAQMTFLLEL